MQQRICWPDIPMKRDSKNRSSKIWKSNTQSGNIFVRLSEKQAMNWSPRDQMSGWCVCACACVFLFSCLCGGMETIWILSANIITHRLFSINVFFHNFQTGDKHKNTHRTIDCKINWSNSQSIDSMQSNSSCNNC